MDDQFKQLREAEHAPLQRRRPDRAGLLALLQRDVVARFECHSPLRATVTSFGPGAFEEDEDPPDNPGHPACAAHSGSDYCHESWQLHLAQLNAQPRTHWHRCRYGLFCGLVPVVHAGRCLAVVKIAGPAAAATTAFEHEVNLLDTLVRDFVGARAQFLERLLRAEPAAAQRRQGHAGRTDGPDTPLPEHPLVAQTRRYVEDHLADPGLSVRRIAGALAVHANYLSSVFAGRVGVRLSRFITETRMARARELLATTDWQVKRIASACGYANPNWFSHVFGASTGLSPGEFRARFRAPAASEPPAPAAPHSPTLPKPPAGSATSAL